MDPEIQQGIFWMNMQKDNRIKVIHKGIGVDGHSMNVDFKMRQRIYSIIETDDFADLNMFDELYKAAKKSCRCCEIKLLLYVSQRNLRAHIMKC